MPDRPSTLTIPWPASVTASPVVVPWGTLIFVLPSSVGTVTVPPSAAVVMGIVAV